MYPNPIPEQAVMQQLQRNTPYIPPFQNAGLSRPNIEITNARQAQMNAQQNQEGLRRATRLFDQNQIANDQYEQEVMQRDYQQGGEYDLTDQEIEYILANGGSVDYL